ncbi:MAG: hypothetical protein ACLFQB_04535 [Chitinispirillaceae bacterium]
MNKYLFVVPACGEKAGGCHKMKNCLSTAKGLAQSGNVVKLVVDNTAVLPLENKENDKTGEKNCGVECARGDNQLLFTEYLEKGYAVIRF